jgi:hypothetical protein
VSSDQILRIQYKLQIECTPVEASATPSGVSDSFSLTNIGTINGVHLIQSIRTRDFESDPVTDSDGNIVPQNTADEMFLAGITPSNGSSGGTSDRSWAEPSAINTSTVGVAVVQDGVNNLASSFEPSFTKGRLMDATSSRLPFDDTRFSGVE